LNAFMKAADCIAVTLEFLATTSAASLANPSSGAAASSASIATFRTETLKLPKLD
jgi:hypothetical protein